MPVSSSPNYEPPNNEFDDLDSRRNKMDKQEIITKLNGLMGKVMMTLTNAEVKEEDRLIDDLGMDSMAAVDLVFALEDEYDIEISDEEAEKIETIGEIVDLVIEKTNA